MRLKKADFWQKSAFFVGSGRHEKVYALFEWTSRDAYERYLAWRTENGTQAQLMSLLDGL